MAAELQRTSAIEQKPSAIIIAQGKVLDFVDGITQREETPEEYVRQEIAKSLVREIERQVVEYLDGTPVYQPQRMQEKVVDDNTLQIAEGFRRWLSEQE